MRVTDADIDSLPHLWRDEVRNGGHVPYLVGLGLHARQINVEKFKSRLKSDLDYDGIERRKRATEKSQGA